VVGFFRILFIFFEKEIIMRDLAMNELALISGGLSEETIQARNDFRLGSVGMALFTGPAIGAAVGVGMVSELGLQGIAYSVGGFVAGGFAGIVVAPVVARVGVELMFAMADILVPAY
jgi:hypothetical protein